MSEANQVNTSDASAIVPLKRKRGRPSKHPRSDLDRNPRAHGESTGVPPPGFPSVNRSQPRQVVPLDGNEHMIGQVVHGVIDAAFDAGYLLTVQVGNLETALRGVVFKPGHYVPVNADIDVAPGVQMVQRNEIPLPRENYCQVHTHTSRSRERNGTVHAPRAANQVCDKGKQVSESSGIPRGNVVPVILQPVSLANGAAKGKQVLGTGHPSNGSTTTTANQLEAVETQLPHFQSHNNQQSISSSLQHAGVNHNSGEASSLKLPGMPFEKLLTEVIKRVEVVPPQSPDTNTSSAAKLSAEDYSTDSEDENDDEDDRALSVEPMRVVQPNLLNQPTVITRPLENYRTGKMTELLQVLQENMTEKSVAQEQGSTQRSQTELEMK